MINWCVNAANGYLAGTYSLPSWAKSMLHGGTLQGAALSGLGSLGGFTDWMQENPWFVKTVGDGISNYGEYLTAKNVQDAIKANTDQMLTKADAMALLVKLQEGGFIPQGKTETVAKGASLATQPSWMMPAIIGGIALVVIMAIKK